MIADFGAEADAAVKAACASFPAEFGLWGYPWGVFRVSFADSYVSAGAVVIYTERKTEAGGWQAFAKGSVTELRAALCSVPTEER